MKHAFGRKRSGFRRNLALAKRLWSGQIYMEQQRALRSLSENYGLSVAAGDLQLLESRWYVTHTGLIRLAQRRGCSGISVNLMTEFCDSLSSRWVFKATVYRSSSSRGFVGYGDADPSNCSTLVHGAEMRVAETRAVNRALRKAYGIGLCSVEELGSFSRPPQASSAAAQSNGSHASNSSGNGQPRLRDQLCLLIRQYNLDPTLVKAYAADFCGTQTLSGASRDLVESFISHLGAAAKENRDALVCKLNSYAQSQEVKP
jgi:hypothetical protein